ncbi:hypothetical protein Pelo_5876 [Pelomyxa schiedti]|nr:hypothetical protein Pelo_5876 [Pelomyxa schiedti]
MMALQETHSKAQKQLEEQQAGNVDAFRTMRKQNSVWAAWQIYKKVSLTGVLYYTNKMNCKTWTCVTRMTSRRRFHQPSMSSNTRILCTCNKYRRKRVHAFRSSHYSLYRDY